MNRFVQKNSEISNDISVVIKKLNLKENEQKELYSDSDMQLNDFCTWLWRGYMQIHCALQGEITVDRKELSGVTKQLHSLYRSSQLLQKWKNCHQMQMWVLEERTARLL